MERQCFKLIKSYKYCYSKDKNMENANKLKEDS